MILSNDLEAAAALIMISTPSAAARCSLYEVPPLFVFALFVFDLSRLPLFMPSPLPILLLILIYSVIRFHISSTQSLLLRRSKMPSQPIMIKSKLSCILNEVMSGSQTITFGLPPYLGRLASMSPNVFETLSLPGNTRSGPYTYMSFSPGLVAAFANVYVRYILPPAA